MINVLIADHQTFTREGVISVLSTSSDIQVVGTATSLTELEQLFTQFKPEVIIMDYYFSPYITIQDFKKNHAQFKSAHILAFSNRQSKSEILDVIEQGVKNYICKECSRDELIMAIYATAKGEQFFCKNTLQELFGDRLPKKKDDNGPMLTFRETEIVRLIADGMANRDIAEKLFLSIHTVKTHRKNIIKKLGFTFKNASDLVFLLDYLNDMLAGTVQSKSLA